MSESVWRCGWLALLVLLLPADAQAAMVKQLKDKKQTCCDLLHRKWVQLQEGYVFIAAERTEAL